MACTNYQEMTVKCEETYRRFQQKAGSFPYTQTILHPPLLQNRYWPGFERIELHKKYVILKKMNETVGIINSENGEIVDEKYLHDISPQILRKPVLLNINGSDILFIGYCHQIDTNKYLIYVSSGSTQSNTTSYFCLYDNFKLRWSVQIDFPSIEILSETRALVGINNTKLINLETGDGCFEYNNRYQVSYKYDNELIIIDDNAIVDIETGKLLWSLKDKYKYPVYHDLFFLNDHILEIDRGRFLFYERLTGKLAKEFNDRNASWDASGVTGTFAYGSIGNHFFCYDLENKTYLVSYADKILLSYGASFVHDYENIYIGDEIGVICYNIKNKKFIWKKDFSSLKKLQEHNGNTYMNVIHRDANLQVTETLYLAKNDSLDEIISITIDTGFNKLYWQNFSSLFPLETGILHIPYVQKKDNQPCLYDYQTKKQKMILGIPSWGEYPNTPVFTLNNNTLAICCDGMSVNIVDLGTGENANISLAGAKGTHNISIIINELYAFVNLGYESYLVDLKEKRLTKVFDSHHAVRNPLFIYNEWLVASDDLRNPRIEIINLKTHESNKYDHVYLGATEKAIIAYNPEEKYFYKRYFSNIEKEEIIKYEELQGSNSFTFNNYHCTNGGIANLDDGKFIQKLPNTLNGLVFPFDGKLSLNDYGSIYTLSPCQSFSVKRLDATKFQIELTRDENEAGTLFGKAFLLLVGEDGKHLPIISDVTNNFAVINLSKKGEKQLVEFSLPDENKSVFSVDNSISKKTKLGLVMITNGLLDTKNSELSDFDKEGRPLFDSIPISLEKQQSIVVTVWDRHYKK